MSEDSRNMIGLLCRGCLLAVVGSGVVAAVAVAMAAAVSLPAGGPSRLCVPDGLVREGFTVRVVADFVPQLPSRITGYMMLSGLEGTPRSQALMDGKDFRLSPKVERPGVYNFDVSGVPYGGFSFLTSRSQIVVVPADRPVYILDALLVQPPSAAEVVTRVISRLESKGSVAYIHPGPPAEYLKFRERLRASGDVRPVLCTNDLVAGAEMAMVYLATALGLDSARHAPAEIITGDVGLARLAVPRRFTVRFIGATRTPVGTPYSSLEDFAAKLGE